MTHKWYAALHPTMYPHIKFDAYVNNIGNMAQTQSITGGQIDELTESSKPIIPQISI